MPVRGAAAAAVCADGGAARAFPLKYGSRKLYFSTAAVGATAVVRHSWPFIRADGTRVGGVAAQPDASQPALAAGGDVAGSRSRLLDALAKAPMRSQQLPATPRATATRVL